MTGGGFPRGRTTLLCGGPGCGKTLLATQFLVRGAIERGEPGVLLTFEESASQLCANVRSLGWDLDALIDQGLLVIDNVSPPELTLAGEWDLDALMIRLDVAIKRVGATRVAMAPSRSFSTRFTRAIGSGSNCGGC